MPVDYKESDPTLYVTALDTAIDVDNEHHHRGRGLADMATPWWAAVMREHEIPLLFLQLIGEQRCFIASHATVATTNSPRTHLAISHSCPSTSRPDTSHTIIAVTQGELTYLKESCARTELDHR